MISGLLSLLIQAVLSGSPQDPETLIERFRSDSVQERSAAAEALKALGPPAVPALEKAAKDPDGEVAARARHLLRWLDVHATIPPEVREAFPGIEDRLAAGEDHGWLDVFFETKKRRPVSRRLRELSDKEWALLAVRALGGGTLEEKVKVCDEIGAMNLRGAREAVRALLKAPEDELRGAALWAIEGMGDVDAIPDLLPLLQHKSASTQGTAAKVLASFGNRSGIPVLAAQLKNPDFRILLEATDALITFDGREALEAIRQVSKEAFDRNCRKAAAEALCGMARLSEIPDLVRILNDDDEEIRGHAAWALRRLDPPAETLPMEQLLEKDSRACRALLASARMGTLWKDQGPRVVGLLKSKDPILLISVVSVLGSLGARQAVPSLIPLVDHPYAYLRQATITALGQLGDPAAAKAIAGHLSDPEAAVRQEALKALALLGSKDLAPEIVSRLEDKELWVRGHAATALSDLGLKTALSAIRPLLADPEAHVRKDARRAMVHLQKLEAIPDLLAQLQAKESPDRVLAAQLLSELGATSSAPSLIPPLKDPDEGVRHAAASALACLGAGADAVEAARTLLQHEDPRFRASACRALGTWNARGAIPSLLPLLRDEHAIVSVSAAKALCRLGAFEGVGPLLHEARLGGRDSLIELNALRAPELWKRIAAIRSAVVFEGTQEDILEKASRIAGMTFEGREHCLRGVSFLVAEFGASSGRAVVDLLQYLEFGTSSNLDLVFEPDRIRILTRADAIRFWQEWGKANRK